MEYRLIVLSYEDRVKVIDITGRNTYKPISIHGNSFLRYEESDEEQRIDEARKIVSFMKDNYNVDDFSDCPFRITVMDCGGGRNLAYRLASDMRTAVEINVVAFSRLLPWILQQKNVLNRNTDVFAVFAKQIYAVRCDEELYISISPAANTDPSRITVEISEEDLIRYYYPIATPEKLETVRIEIPPTKEEIERMKKELREQLVQEQEEAARKAEEEKKRIRKLSKPQVITLQSPKNETASWLIKRLDRSDKPSLDKTIFTLRQLVPDESIVKAGQVIGIQDNDYYEYNYPSILNIKSFGNIWTYSQVVLYAPCDGKLVWLSEKNDGKEKNAVTYAYTKDPQPIAVIGDPEDSRHTILENSGQLSASEEKNGDPASPTEEKSQNELKNSMTKLAALCETNETAAIVGLMGGILGGISDKTDN